MVCLCHCCCCVSEKHHQFSWIITQCTPHLSIYNFQIKSKYRPSFVFIFWFPCYQTFCTFLTQISVIYSWRLVIRCFLNIIFMMEESRCRLYLVSIHKCLAVAGSLPGNVRQRLAISHAGDHGSAALHGCHIFQLGDMGRDWRPQEMGSQRRRKKVNKDIYGSRYSSRQWVRTRVSRSDTVKCLSRMGGETKAIP